MDDPIAEIPTAIRRCAGATTADAQITAFETYFTRDATFLHPACYVPSGHDSRRRIIGIYLFYRGMIPETSFEIQTTALDPDTLHLYVDLIQRPSLRGLRWLIGAPAVPMHIHFHLRRVGEKYFIDSQEDLIQVRSLLMAIPVVRWFGAAFYFLCEVMGLLTAHIFIALGVWRPVQHLQKHVDRLDNFR